MAFPGVMIAVGFVACTWLPARVFVGVTALACIAFAVAVGIPPLGTRLFGFIDEVAQRPGANVPYNTPRAGGPRTG